MEIKKKKFKKAIMVKSSGVLVIVMLGLLVQGMLWAGGKVESVWKKEEMKKEKETPQKTAYLTFDDGPSILTEKYLEILEKENVHGTFFLIGEQIQGEGRKIVQKEWEKGHELGAHTYSHEACQIYCSKETYCKDIEKTALCIEKIVGKKPAFYRFPWGSANAYVKPFKKELVNCMKERGMDYVDWNVSGEDSIGTPTVDSILQNIRKDYTKYTDPVILLHDSASCKATLQALPLIIKELKEQGYSFATLSQRKGSCHFGEY